MDKAGPLLLSVEDETCNCLCCIEEFEHYETENLCHCSHAAIFQRYHRARWRMLAITWRMLAVTCLLSGILSAA